MKTVVLEQPGRLRLTETQPPDRPGPGEALVRVHRVGICGTDLHAFQGHQPFFSYPRILGHELGVEVLAIGPTDQEVPLAVGDRCSVEPYLNCGQCSACRRGKPNCCLHLKVLGVSTDGGMREVISVPIAKLHRSAVLAFDQLALVEMLCIGAHAVRRAGLEPGEEVLVIGAGPIGLSVIRFAQLAGAHVIAMEVSERRREFCRRHLGVERWVDGNRDPLPQLQALLDGDLPTAVFDATGNAASMMRAFSSVAHGGRLVFVGLFQGDVTFHDPDFHRRELTLLGSRNATGADFAQAIALLEAGQIDLAPWITHRVAPEEIAAAFPGWLDPERGTVKAMLEFSPMAA
jgi:2-desacetyl-2-hydroxyethyl bacteriochlorophyllide A dehydrogenase